MSCYCQPQVVTITPKTCEGRCLRLATLRIGCDDGPSCSETVQTDLEEYNDTSEGVNVKYKLDKDSYDGFTSVSLTEAGVLTFTTDDEITPNEEEVISYNVYEDGGLLSATGYYYICSEDKCKGVDCETNEDCDSCTGTCYGAPDLSISSSEDIIPDLEITP